MKRVMIVVLLATPLLLMPLTAGASHSPGKGPKNDKADATGRRDVPAGVESVHINAKSGPNGEDPSGQVRWTLKTATGTESMVAAVNCLEVEGNMADLEAVVTRSDSPTITVGQTMFATIIDNGEPSTFDLFGSDFGAPETPGGRCDGTTVDATHRGNYVVHDAS